MSDPTAFLHGAVTSDAAEQLPVPVNKGGRPTKYTPELAERICELMGKGKSIKLICGEEGMPHAATVFRWLDQHADFRLSYTYAQAAKEQIEEDEILEIADDASQDFQVQPAIEDVLEGQAHGGALKRSGGPGIVTFNKEAVARSKLRVETRQWKIERSKARKYVMRDLEQELLPPGSADGSNAKDMGAADVIESHPLGDALSAWSKVAAPAAQGDPA